MQRLAGIEKAHMESVVYNAALHQKATFFPLGFPVEITTNSARVLQAALQGWERFSKAFDEEPIRVHLGICEDSGDGGPSVPAFRSRGHLLSILSGPNDFITCDLSQGAAFGWLSESTASDPGFLRYYFLEAAVYGMIHNLHLAAVHGALISRKGSGVLLCGDSFAGKSTLAYGCARAGWTFISDDGTFLLRRRSDRFAIGNPHAFRLREDAIKLFPELADRPTIVRPNGKMGIEVLTSQLPGISIAPGSVIDHVVFLNRQSGADVHLGPYAADQALRWCEQFASLGTAAVLDAQRAVCQRLVGAGVWELRYQDLDAAIHRLERLVNDGE